ncbi:GNAT family N-acetyltransferase [Neolewinella agarilytica]|uniref:Acetyltransferase (GNAT) family protein n=1 Tax=Neolewinella agarilytica TaxID=478744 RepID=A0A1H8ZU98_9BACT|nr:GNAT family N-acetyltransferase [Neolewinella agarilytica]SEP67954.1 Acetyltransferase (GNAT) family protein [Neolewinella agarilytica]
MVVEKYNTINKIAAFPVEGFKALQQESQLEGYRFLLRLEKDWLNGTNTFSAAGEGLYEVRAQGELVAIGGINTDPYGASAADGRLRRFYVKEAYRRKGVGKMLVDFILQQHAANFERVSLYTGELAAGAFYVRCGFEKVLGEEKVSHRIELNS